MQKKARIGLIGAGWWMTAMHLPALLDNPLAEVVALADINAEKLAAAAKHYHIEQTYSDYHAMLENVPLDGVIIATYHATHYEIARDCLEHGLHVLLEKPMVLYAPHAQELVQIAARQGRELIIGYPYFFTPHILKAKSIMGRLGEIHYVNCVFGSEVWKYLQGNAAQAGPVHGPGTVYSDPALSGGGQGHLQVTHSASLMLFLTGLRPQRVLALMNNLSAKVDVVDAMTVEFQGGALGNVGSYGHAGGGTRLDITIYAENGSMYIESFTGRVEIHNHDGDHQRIGPIDDRQKLHAGHTTSQNLVDVILGRAANGSPAEIGWYTVELLDAAYRSAGANGAAISISDLYTKAAQT